MKEDNWTPKEIAALKRALAKLRAAQPPVPKNPFNNSSGHKGIYWHAGKERFMVYMLHDGMKVYCGQAPTIEGALTMQSANERRMSK